MSDDTNSKSEEKTPTQQLIEKVVPTVDLSSIKNVLGDTEVDLNVEDSAFSKSPNVTAPTASAIPKRPNDLMNTATVAHNNNPIAAPLNKTVSFSTDSPNSKPPIFGSRIGRFISIVIGLGLVIGMIFVIVYFLTSGRSFVFPDFIDSQKDSSTNAPVVVNQETTTDVPSAIPASDNDTLNNELIDTDGDGLLDSKEIQIKTDPKKVDTDGDGLTDRQEVEIYKTSPLKKDTDGDGFSDGAEVRNFYNPNGDGQLLNITEEINAIANTNAQPSPTNNDQIQ